MNNKSRIKRPSKFVNVMLILTGGGYSLVYGFLTFMAIFQLISYFQSPSYYGSYYMLYSLQSKGLIFLIGVWAIIASIGILKGKLWSMGEALVILILMITFQLDNVIPYILDPIRLMSYPFSLVFLTTIILEFITFFLIFSAIRKNKRIGIGVSYAEEPYLT